jgi:hypothetical protein
MKEVMGEAGSFVGWVQRTNARQIPWNAADVVHFPVSDPITQSGA